MVRINDKVVAIDDAEKSDFTYIGTIDEFRGNRAMVSLYPMTIQDDYSGKQRTIQMEPHYLRTIDTFPKYKIGDLVKARRFPKKTHIPIQAIIGISEINAEPNGTVLFGYQHDAGSPSRIRFADDIPALHFVDVLVDNLLAFRAHPGGRMAVRLSSRFQLKLDFH